MTIHNKCKMPIKSAITVGEKSVECYLTGVKTVTVKMAGVDLVATMATMTAASGAAAGGGNVSGSDGSSDGCVCRSSKSGSNCDRQQDFSDSLIFPLGDSHLCL